VHAMSFSSGGAWTVVTWNESPTAVQYGVKVPGSASVGKAVVTNESQSLVDGTAPVRTESGAWLVKLPPKTIATYTFSN
jgi:hypothetical protein